ncbi:glycoside hydrolase [Ascobolus immersus RN42]|uniref:Glycoside hydrolase n=1 Tax=Ascobolus immersus RN42 TaxID=1160509 RepID=A0A3N4HRZ6_ASCIM|nr:glycoside hydrolase [Ascobolus immersus RN42]
MVGILRTDGPKIVDENGTEVFLKGAAIGGWMNMENFITGYPGMEHQFRRSLENVLGPELAHYYFDRLLHHFFTPADAQFFASLGLNAIRIPFNYRHFEDDLNPRVLKEEGFKHLDNVIKICADAGIYTILDLHAAAGCQNPDWHSDNASNFAGFWEHRDFQDRTIWLWEIIAERYKSNPWVAGYNPLNEPCDPHGGHRLVAFYDRAEKAIRKIDPHHMLFLDGNTFAIDFRAFEKPDGSLLREGGWPNCVFALHDYALLGFPSTEDEYEGTPDQDAVLEKQFLRKSEFMRRHNFPVWNGEFGPVYQPPSQTNAEEINSKRYNLLGAQLRLYDEKYRISGWSIWLYKDLGLQGMVSPGPDTPYQQRFGAFFAKKKRLQADHWGHTPNPEIEAAFAPLIAFLEKEVPELNDKYPTTWTIRRHLRRNVQETLVAEVLNKEFAELFRGLDKEGLEALAASWNMEKCTQRKGLNSILRKAAGLAEE